MKNLSLLSVLLFGFNLAIFSQSTEFWGASSSGGTQNLGSLFTTNSEGENPLMIHSFISEFEGNNPRCTDLLTASNGKIYGYAEGGRFGYGIIFEYDVDSSKYSKKVDFDGINGASPVGGLIEAKNGFLYGVTRSGNFNIPNNGGAIFEYEISTGSIQIIYQLNDSLEGDEPSGSLLKASNGKLYGLTSIRDRFNQGTLFEFSLQTNTLTVLKKFQDTISGSNPVGSLTQASNGNLYGVTQSGGSARKGVLFEYNIIQDSLINRFEFNPSTGQAPQNSLSEAPNGKLYGTTTIGGSLSRGTIFEYDPNTKMVSKKHDFSSQSLSQGSNLKLLSNNSLIGTQEFAGSFGYGNIYEFNFITDTYTQRFYYPNDSLGGRPYSSLINGENGYLYGLTLMGGIENEGVMYRLDTSSFQYQKLFDFGYSPGGRNPSSGLILENNGLLYGITRTGGINGVGTLYSYNRKTDSLVKILDFSDTLYGSYPSGLFQMSNGNLYGICSAGGKQKDGVLFEYNPTNNTYTKKIEFGGLFSDLKKPQATLIETSNGKLYGLTYQGGQNNSGSIFEFNLNTDSLTKKISFPYVNASPLRPERSLFIAKNNKIYGTDSRYKLQTNSILFEYDSVNDSIIELQNITSPFGGNEQPTGGLIETKDSKLFGTTLFGGVQGFGTLFEYDYQNDSLRTKHNFLSYLTGFRPNGSLLLSKKNKIYGSSMFGGTFNRGVLYEFDPLLNTTKVKLNFNGTNGAPLAGSLIEINACYTTNSIIAIDSILKSTIEDASYQWFKCNGNLIPIPGATSQTYQLTDSGRFAVEIRKGNCIDTSTCFIVYAIGIAENTDLNKVSIYPNPFNKSFTVSNLSSKELVIKLLNPSGKLIEKKRVGGNTDHILNFSIPTGLYILEINVDGNRQHFKLIKE